MLARQGLTLRSLSARTRAIAGDRGISHGHIANLISGRDHPSTRVLELLAEALEVPPEHFAEYRLAALRNALDERAVGFDAAWRRYLELADPSPAADSSDTGRMTTRPSGRSSTTS